MNFACKNQCNFSRGIFQSTGKPTSDFPFQISLQTAKRSNTKPARFRIAAAPSTENFLPRKAFILTQQAEIYALNRNRHPRSGIASCSISARPRPALRAINHGHKQTRAPPCEFSQSNSATTALPQQVCHGSFAQPCHSSSLASPQQLCRDSPAAATPLQQLAPLSQLCITALAQQLCAAGSAAPALPQQFRHAGALPRRLNTTIKECVAKASQVYVWESRVGGIISRSEDSKRRSTAETISDRMQKMLTLNPKP